MTNGKQILIIDDDTVLVEMLSEQLRLHEEFAPVSAASGAEALELSKKHCYDVIILDVGLPDMDGRGVCRLMRRNGVRSPIIMLLGVDADADTNPGIDAGANDYITKPFRLSVLLARLRAHIRLPSIATTLYSPLGHTLSSLPISFCLTRRGTEGCG